MIVGIDFPSFFDKDNFTSRRTTGHNMHDPESFITGKELAEGHTYTNSRRSWANKEHYLAAVVGFLTPEEIAKTAPRISYSLLRKHPREHRSSYRGCLGSKSSS
jgi:hypothetical protein